MTQAQVSLKSLLVPSKALEVEFPGLPDFKIEISFLSRETLQNIRKKATKATYKNRQQVDELNDDLFLELYVKAAIKGWKGLTFDYLNQLAPVDISGVDVEAELPFSDDNALYLMKSSNDFDSFISQQVTELANFSKIK